MEEIVAQQFKELIEEKLVDFKYKYYVDVDVDWTNALGKADTNITIEEFDKLKGARPNYMIFLSSEALAYSDEELYELIGSIATTHHCLIDIFFITNDYFNKIDEYFSIYPILESGSLYRELSSVFGRVILFTIEKDVLREDLNKFTELMKEVRNNELYR